MCVCVVDLLAAFRVNLSVDVIRLLWIILTKVPPKLHDTLTYTLADFQMSADNQTDTVMHVSSENRT